MSPFLYNLVESFSVGRITIHTSDLKVVVRACYGEERTLLRMLLDIWQQILFPVGLHDAAL